ncbi:high affinity copper uptake protein 1-like [Zerene cesonia]|uniref:high affinity copper uptake protein 1-like n=1 Tax=Zerene cesonia TaxID=33412 RepID=UPI0018E53ED1|nr:high affinity copper uptake protein 1-like [Zerene cesonia]
MEHHHHAMEAVSHNHEEQAIAPSSCHGDHGHAMVFHAGVVQEILFKGWETSNALELFGSCVAIFVASVLYEGFKYYRETLFEKAALAATADSQVNIAKNENGTNRSCHTRRTTYTMFSSGHIYQTGLYFVQAWVSYILMLVFMTYNVWLCLALVLGLALGYFLFGWRKTTAIDNSECCM